MRKIIVLTSIILAFSFNILNAQEDSSAESDQAPWYFYWPQEDPDNFSLSTMGSRTEESTQSGSTFSTKKAERRSNVDVNRPKESKKNSKIDTTAVDEYIAEVESVNQQGSAPTQGDSSNIYKWVDGNGEVHVTNNPDSIPQEYRNQVIDR